VAMPQFPSCSAIHNPIWSWWVVASWLPRVPGSGILPSSRSIGSPSRASASGLSFMCLPPGNQGDPRVLGRLRGSP
jgi:hypothetical protein